jgi:ATP-dependent Lon protease
VTAQPKVDGLAVDSEILPVLPLRDGVLYPGACCHVLLTTVGAYGAVREATRAGHRPVLAVVALRGPGETAEADAFQIGSLATVLGLERSRCCNRWVAHIAAHARLRTTARLRDQPFRIDRVETLVEPDENAQVLAVMVDLIRERARHMVQLDLAPRLDDDCHVLDRLHETSDPEQVIGAAMSLLPGMPLREQQRGLELEGRGDRLAFVLGKMTASLAARGAARGRGGLS